MPLWLAIWIARIASGERLRPSENQDYRIWFGAFFLFPVSVALFVWLGAPLLQRSGIIVWLALTAFGVSDILACLFWARYVPASISLALAIIIWSAAFWFAWHPGSIPWHPL